MSRGRGGGQRRRHRRAPAAGSPAQLGQLGYVQRFGAGIDVARRAMGVNGNPAPGFVVNPTAVNVRLKLLR